MTRQDRKAHLLEILGIKPGLDDADWEAHMAELDAAGERLHAEVERLVAGLTPKERAVLEKLRAAKQDPEKKP